MSKYQIIRLGILFFISIIVAAFELFCIFGSWYYIDGGTISIAEATCPVSLHLKLALEYVYPVQVTVIPILVTFLFGKKLIAVLVGLKQTVVMDGGTVELTVAQEHLVAIVTKHGLLSSVQACYVVIMIFYHIIPDAGVYEDINNPYIIYAPFYVGTKIFGFLWPMCVWLSFIFAVNQYNCICGKCHNGCLKCIKNIAKYQLNKQNQTRIKQINKGKRSSHQNIANDYQKL